MIIDHLGGHSGMLGEDPDAEFAGWKESCAPASAFCIARRDGLESVGCWGQWR